MKLIIQTLPTYFVEEDQILTALFDEGMDILHINKPDSEPLYMERLLSLIPAKMYGKIVIHQNYYLKKEHDLKGIHIDKILSVIFNDSNKELTYVYKCLRNKRLYTKFVELCKIHEANHKGLIDKHVYALGGMSLETVQQAKDMGFGGVVICGDLWNRFSIQHEINFHELISHFRKLKKATN